MSNMMIYALKGAVGGTVEKVYGHEMQTCVIDSTNEKAVSAAKENGYYEHPQEVIDLIEAEKLQAENEVMKGQLADNDDSDKVAELESQLSTALTEIAGLEAKLAIYEETKDANGDGVVSYDEMTIAELSTLLTQRKVEHNKRDGKDALIKLATDSE